MYKKTTAQPAAVQLLVVLQICGGQAGSCWVFCWFRGCESVSALLQRRGRGTQWAALDSCTQMCDYAGLKPCQDLLREVLTFTESVVLHVRTNGGFRESQQRPRGEEESLFISPNFCYYRSSILKFVQKGEWCNIVSLTNQKRVTGWNH